MGRFAINLKRIRTERRITQGQFADSIGVSRSAVGMWETGEREPDYETLEAIADYFNVAMSDLIGSTESTNEVDEMREELRANPDLRMLLSASRNLDAEDIRQLVALAERMNRE